MLYKELTPSVIKETFLAQIIVRFNSVNHLQILANECLLFPS